MESISLNNEVLKSDRMKQVTCHIDGYYKLYLFTPTLFRQFPKSGNMHQMTVKQRIRFLTLYLHGYRVYVLSDINDNVLGCATFSNGGTFRYPFATQKDLICGPYFINPSYRNQGIATKLLTEIIDNHETQYQTIYAHIWHENIASIHCMEKIGFKKVGNLSTSRGVQKCYLDDEGFLVLVAMDISNK